MEWLIGIFIVWVIYHYLLGPFLDGLDEGESESKVKTNDTNKTKNKAIKGRVAIIAGTGFNNDNGSRRAEIIRDFCKVDTPVVLKREPNNKFDSNAIAVYIEAGGLKQIGYVKKGTAKHYHKRLDSGENITGKVLDVWHGEEVLVISPKVRVELSV